MGVVWLAALALLAGTNAWLSGGCLGPLRDLPEPEFVLATRPLWQLPVWWFGACAVAAGVARPLARRMCATGSAHRWSRSARLASLVLLSMPLVAVGALASPLRHYAAPWVYLFLDLHVWVLGGAAALLTIDIDAAMGRPLGRRIADLLGRVTAWPASRAWLDGALVVVLMAASLATSPLFRFQSALIGDEPKYVRYLENWYRGRGMDMTDLVPISTLPPGDPPSVLHNLRLLKVAVASVVSDVGQDLGRLVGASTQPRPGPARGAGGWFVEGKRGGIYQVHTPGLSLLLFPGYVIDRASLNWTSSFHPQFPSDLYCTGALILVLYLAWGVAIFRLFVAYTGRVAISWVVSCLVLMSLPSSAFAYQYYPEVAGGLAIALLARFVLLSADRRPLSVLAHGVVAGFLPWLHVRFGLVALLSVLFFALTRRRAGSAVLTFVAAFMVPVAALGAYYYYVTGSVMPWALHALCTDEASPFGMWRAVHDLPNYWFDAGGGLVAHAPFYLLAVPGLWLAWRRSRALTVATALIVLALAVPAAGHGWVGGGTTPLRLVAAVVPLLALPLAEAVIYYSTSRWFAALLALLSVVSLQNGWTYNTHLIKSEPWLRGPTISGWLSPLLLPDFTVDSRIAEPSVWIWVVMTFTLLAWPIVRRHSPGAARTVPSRSVSWTVAVTALALALAVVGSLLGGWTGHRLRTRFMTDEETVRYRLLTFEAAHPGGRVWLSSGGWIGLASLFPNPPDTAIATSVTPAAVRVGQAVAASIATDPRLRSRVWGRATIDFGDHTKAVHRRFVGGFTTRHQFPAPGDYVVRFDISLPGAPTLHRVETVRVEPVPEIPALPAEALAVLPPDLMSRPIAVAIDEVRCGESLLELRCVLARRPRAERLWVWVISAEDGLYKAHLYHGQVSAAGGNARTVRLRVIPLLTAEDRELIGVVVGVGREGRLDMAGRSDVVTLPWPGRRITLGAEIVEQVSAARR